MKKFIIIVVLAAIAKFSFAQQLQKGNLVGVHVMTVTLKPGVTMEQFKKYYVSEVIPAYENAYTGVKGFLLEARRGESKDQLGILWYFNSESDRDKYFAGEDFTEAGKEASSKTAEIDKKTETFATVNTTFTDWVLQ